MAIGNPEIIHIMNKVKAPYNINKMTSKIGFFFLLLFFIINFGINN